MRAFHQKAAAKYDINPIYLRLAMNIPETKKSFVNLTSIIKDLTTF
jgi:hypothetical protein